jgi:NOL1/NOP2/sun family putative RNA methylase
LPLEEDIGQMRDLGLPAPFVERMRELLSSEAERFLESLDRPAERAARANPLKLDPSELPAVLGLDLDSVPWCEEAFFLPQGVRAGATPAHAAGLLYLQEPSALLPVEALEVRPGQRVLDLAAAPGGKTTQVAGKLGAAGVVVANEVETGRLRALAENLDRWGSWRVVVCNEPVERLAERLAPGSFDRVLLDAPCSGEGLFRRSAAARTQWRPGHVRGSAERQRRLLRHAARLVRPGGVLVYSTCTFAPEENEQQVAAFLEEHRDWEVLEIPWRDGFAPGRPDWCPDGPAELERTVRLWPHRLRGDGHFVAKLGRHGAASGSAAAHGAAATQDESAATQDESAATHGAAATQDESAATQGARPARAGRRRERERARARGSGDTLTAWQTFAADTLRERPPAPVIVGERAYLAPDDRLVAGDLRWFRPGLPLGRSRPGRFEPAHALALALHPTAARRHLRLGPQQARAFLRGETLPCSEPAGWTLVTMDDWPLGWGRVSGGALKSQVPRGLRAMVPAR